jgi:hypothetical protein
MQFDRNQAEKERIEKLFKEFSAVKGPKAKAKWIMDHPEVQDDIVTKVEEIVNKGNTVWAEVLTAYNRLRKEEQERDQEFVARARSKLGNHDSSGGGIMKVPKNWANDTWTLIAAAASILTILGLGWFTLWNGFEYSYPICLIILLASAHVYRRPSTGSLARVWLGLTIVSGVILVIDLLGITFLYGVNVGFFLALFTLIVASYVILRKPKKKDGESSSSKKENFKEALKD